MDLCNQKKKKVLLDLRVLRQKNRQDELTEFLLDCLLKCLGSRFPLRMNAIAANGKTTTVHGFWNCRSKMLMLRSDSEVGQAYPA